MYKGYRLSCKFTEEFYTSYESYFDTNLSSNAQSEASVISSIRKIINGTDVINADKIAENVFPKIDCDIFISHAHVDARKAKAIAAYLHKQLGLTCFIDSFAWGNIKDIQSEIDEDCKSGPSTWNYNLRNRSTSHVHMMLAMSLLDMMDKCECLFLIDSPASISAKSVINDSTMSPWIFMEMFCSKLLRIKLPKRHEVLFEAIANADVLKKDSTDTLPRHIEHRIDLSHLTKINGSYIASWVKFAKESQCRGARSLDILYLDKHNK